MDFMNGLTKVMTMKGTDKDSTYVVVAKFGTRTLGLRPVVMLNGKNKKVYFGVRLRINTPLVEVARVGFGFKGGFTAKEKHCSATLVTMIAPEPISCTEAHRIILEHDLAFLMAEYVHKSLKSSSNTMDFVLSQEILEQYIIESLHTISPDWSEAYPTHFELGWAAQ